MQRRQSTAHHRLHFGWNEYKGRLATFANCSVRFIHRSLIYGLILCPSLIRSKGWPYHNGPTFIIARCSSAVHTSVPVVRHKYATRSNILLSPVDKKMGCCARTSMLIRGRTDAGLLNFSKRLFITVTEYFPVIRAAPKFRKYSVKFVKWEQSELFSLHALQGFRIQQISICPR